MIGLGRHLPIRNGHRDPPGSFSRNLQKSELISKDSCRQIPFVCRSISVSLLADYLINVVTKQEWLLRSLSCCLYSLSLGHALNRYPRMSCAKIRKASTIGVHQDVMLPLFPPIHRPSWPAKARMARFIGVLQTVLEVLSKLHIRLRLSHAC